MDGSVGRAIAVVLGSTFALATLSVVFSTRSNTAAVLQTGGAAFSGIISAATAPVTGTGSVTSAASSIAGLAAPGYAGSSAGADIPFDL
jgi:hypothetical protein